MQSIRIVNLGLPARVWGKRYRGAGGFSAGVAFPAVTDFDTLHEFRWHGRDQPVAAVWAAYRYCYRANGGRTRWIAMRLHDPDFCLQERLTLIHRRRREYVQEHILIFQEQSTRPDSYGFIFWFLIFQLGTCRDRRKFPRHCKPIGGSPYLCRTRFSRLRPKSRMRPLAQSRPNRQGFSSAKYGCEVGQLFLQRGGQFAGRKESDKNIAMAPQIIISLRRLPYLPPVAFAVCFAAYLRFPLARRVLQRCMRTSRSKTRPGCQRNTRSVRGSPIATIQSLAVYSVHGFQSSLSEPQSYLVSLVRQCSRYWGTPSRCLSNRQHRR